MKSKWASWVVCVAAAAAGLKRNWRQLVLRRVAVKTMSKNLSRKILVFFNLNQWKEELKNYFDCHMKR